MGYLTKKGAVVKNWKRRYFVANSDYSVDYFENEEVGIRTFLHSCILSLIIGVTVALQGEREWLLHIIIMH